MGFDRAWVRVITWLNANAPVSAADVQPPTPAAQLAEARAMFDRPWPDDLVRLYELCDGTGDATRHGTRLFGLKTVVSLEYMLRSRRMILEVMEQFPPGPDDAPEHESATGDPHDLWRWSPRMVPFAEDVSGDNLFVDLRDGPAYGSVGR